MFKIISLFMDTYKPLTEDEYDASSFNYMLGSYIDGDGEWREGTILGENEVGRKRPISAAKKFIESPLDCEVYVALSDRPTVDDGRWILIFEYDKIFYAFDALCSCTGFDAQGVGIVTCGRSPKNFYNLGLTDFMRKCLKHRNVYEEDLSRAPRDFRKVIKNVRLLA